MSDHPPDDSRRKVSDEYGPNSELEQAASWQREQAKQRAIAQWVRRAGRASYYGVDLDGGDVLPSVSPARAIDESAAETLLIDVAAVMAHRESDASERDDSAVLQENVDAESLEAQRDETDRKRLGRNSALMASGTLVSRVLGMVNTMLLAKVVGQALAADAFRLANTLPNYVFVLLGSGVLNAVLLPQITKAMKRADGGKDFVDRLLTAALILIVSVAVICTAGAAIITQFVVRLEGAALHLSIAFAYICMPQVLFYALFAVMGDLLAARGSFGPFGWAPVVNNVVAIGGELAFLHLWGQQTDPAVWTRSMVLVLAGSATLGIIAQVVVLLPVLRRMGFRYTPKFGLRGYGFRQVGRFASLTFIALCVAQAGGIYIANVASGMLSRAAPGEVVAGYAAYQNAWTLFQMPYSLIAFSILTALFPQLTRAWQRRQSAGLKDMRDAVRRALTLPAVGLIPVSLLLAVLARPIVRGIYWGISPEDARVAAELLLVLALALVPYAVVVFQQQYCFATEQGTTNLWMQCVVTGIQICFAFVAGHFVTPAYGMMAICLGTVVGNAVSALIFVAYARRQLITIGLPRIVWLYMRLGVASIVGAIPAFFLSTFIASSDEDALVSQYLACFAGTGIFLLFFVGAAKILAIHELGDFLRPIARRLHLLH